MNLRDHFLQASNGARTWRELKPFVSKARLAKLVGQGELRYDGKGTYRLPAVAVRYSIGKQLRGTLSHLSAAAHWRLQTLDEPDATYVTVSPHRSRVKAPPDVRVFYRSIPDSRVVDGVTDVVQTVLDCARDLALPIAMTVADDALRTRSTTRDALIDAAARLRGPRSVQVRRIVSWADDRAASVMESALRGVLLDAGITTFQPQFPVTISTGALRHADLGDRENRVLIEADSFLNHASKYQLRNDAQRYDEFVAAGYVVLRFTWQHIMADREWLVDMVQRTIQTHRTH